MPTCYFIVTTETAKKLVDETNLNKLNNYLNNGTNEELIDVGKHLTAPWVNNDNTYEERLYHILSYATDKSNLTVLNHFRDKIDTNYVPDGNAYNLIDLAIENYADDYNVNIPENNENKYDTIIFLIKSQLKNYDVVDADYPSRRLVSFLDRYDNYDLLTALVREYDVSLWDVYHYSIAWGYPKVFDKLLDKFYDLIDFNWTKGALEIANRFEQHDTIKHVINKLHVVKPDLKL